MAVEIVEETEESILVKIHPPKGYVWSPTIFGGEWIVAVAVRQTRAEEKAVD